MTLKGQRSTAMTMFMVLSSTHHGTATARAHPMNIT